MNQPLRPRPPARTAAIGGVGVVLVTGLAALAGMGANTRMEPIDWVLTGLILLLTLGGGIAMIRFVRRHGGEIGEARFDTSHAGDPAEREETKRP